MPDSNHHHGRIPGSELTKLSSSTTSSSSRKESEFDLKIGAAESIAGEPSFEFKDLQEDALIRPSSAPPSDQPASVPSKVVSSKSAWGSSSVSYAAILRRAQQTAQAEKSVSSDSQEDSPSAMKHPSQSRVSKTAAQLLRERDA
jgi:hypothetical protein